MSFKQIHNTKKDGSSALFGRNISAHKAAATKNHPGFEFRVVTGFGIFIGETDPINPFSLGDLVRQPDNVRNRFLDNFSDDSRTVGVSSIQAAAIIHTIPIVN